MTVEPTEEHLKRWAGMSAMLKFDIPEQQMVFRKSKPQIDVGTGPRKERRAQEARVRRMQKKGGAK